MNYPFKCTRMNCKCTIANPDGTCKKEECEYPDLDDYVLKSEQSYIRDMEELS